MSLLEDLEQKHLEEKKKYRLDDDELKEWRNKIKKVNYNAANNIARNILKIIKDPYIFDENDDSMLTSVKQLIESGANLNYKNELGNSLLICCIYNNKICIASMLLSYGADPNITGRNGITPVGIACSLGREEFLKLLIYNGADINKRYNNGTMAINGLINTYGFVTWRNCLEILLEHGAIINNTDLCNNGLKEIDGIDDIGINFQEKKKKKLNYQSLLDEAKSHLPKKPNVETSVDIKKRVFKRIQ